MATPAWVQVDRDDYDSQESVRSQDAKELKQRDEAVAEKTIDLEIPEVSTGSATYVQSLNNIVQHAITLPADCNTFKLVFDYKNSAGAEEIDVQVSIIGGSTTVSGTFLSTAATASYQEGTITLTLNADHIGIETDVKIEFKTTISTNVVFLRAPGAISQAYRV